MWAARGDAADGSGALFVSDDGGAPIRIQSSGRVALALETSFGDAGELPSESSAFVTDDGDAHGRRYFPEDVVVVLLVVVVKTYVCSGLGNGDA